MDSKQQSTEESKMDLEELSLPSTSATHSVASEHHSPSIAKKSKLSNDLHDSDMPSTSSAVLTSSTSSLETEPKSPCKSPAKKPKLSLNLNNLPSTSKSVDLSSPSTSKSVDLSSPSTSKSVDLSSPSTSSGVMGQNSPFKRFDEANSSTSPETEKEPENDIIYGKYKRTTILSLMKNDIIRQAYEEEMVRLKSRGQSPKDGEETETSSEGDSDTCNLKSVPKSSKFYPKTKICHHDASFKMKYRRNPGTSNETDDVKKRVEMELVIDDNLLDEIVAENPDPVMESGDVVPHSGSVLNEEDQEAFDSSSPRSKMKQILLTRLLEDSVRAQREEIKALKILKNLSDKIKKM